MNTDRERTHHEECWRTHDDCALLRARDVLEADQSTDQRRAWLADVRFGIASHAAGPCPVLQPRQCVFVERARHVLDSSAGAAPAGATDLTTGDHDHGMATDAEHDQLADALGAS